MTVCSSRCTEVRRRRSATLRRALDAQARGRHRLQPCVADAPVAGLALAVGAVVELGQGVLDVGEGLGELAREGLDLAALRGHLAGVGEVLVEVQAGAVAPRQARELLAQPGSLLLE